MSFGKGPATKDRPISVIENFNEIYHSRVLVGTSAVAVPTLPLTGRKAVILQNGHASQTVYVGATKPDIIKATDAWLQAVGVVGTKYQLEWHLSASGTTEYYATAPGSADPGLTECLRLYGITAAGGSFAVLTNGTMGSLANLAWDWGDNDTLGFSTIYFRCNAGDPDTLDYIQLLSYNRMPTADTGAAGGFKITAGNSSPLLCLDSSVMLFAIASGADTPVIAVEMA